MYKEGISIDLGSGLPYIVDSILSLFGKDAESREWKEKLSQLVKLSAAQASMIQCVGMPQPIPITDIYQRTAVMGPNWQPTSMESVIASGKDATVFAGPGWGKTTLLHWMYIQLCKQGQDLPLLITLRWPNAPEDLSGLVHELHKGRESKKKSSRRMILLVDGYDEIDEKQRHTVSKSLMLFSSLGLGNYYLTCRSHYYIYDLKCSRYTLEPFTREDACRFVSAYSSSYGYPVDGNELVNELEEHHLGEFASHPLMLTLVCILKSGPARSIPRRAIGLLRRAIDTLTFRWDEAKKVHRDSAIPLDGEERVRCLMRIAFAMESPQESWMVVQEAAADHVKLLQVKGVNVRALVEEMARFYGILVPAGEDQWTFAHRIVHDYLSARYWVECGKFNPARVATWDLHAAYAACLTTDATEAMIRMLKGQKEIIPFIECLYNSAPFDVNLVAEAVIDRGSDVVPIRVVTISSGLRVVTNEDIYGVASDEFLKALLLAASATYPRVSERKPLKARAAEGVATLAVGELLRRKTRIRPSLVAQFKTVMKARQATKFECIPGNRSFFFSIDELAACAERSGVRDAH